MKRILALLLVAVLLVGNLPSVMANYGGGGSDYQEQYIEGYYTYEVSEGEALLLGADSAISGDVTIPATLGGYPVTYINSYAFQGCTALTGVTIPDSVYWIGYYAFQDCTGLINVTLPDGITNIIQGLFWGCSSLTNVTIPDGVTQIGSGAFQGCTGLTNITIPDSVTSIESSAFNTCSSLMSIAIPDKVTGIDHHTFYNCINLTSVTIGDGVVSLGADTFRACSNLTTVTLGSSITSIGDSAFYGCNKLADVYYKGTEAQKGNIAIADYNDSLLNASWSYVGEEEEPGIGGTCGDNVTWALDDNGVLTISGTGPMAYAAGMAAMPWAELRNNIYAVVIENGVTGICDGAFDFCEYLTAVSIANSVMTIGRDAFIGCASLTEVAIPNGVTEIAAETFADCSSLTTVDIPDSVTSIGSFAFVRCTSLESIAIPESITSIDVQAFKGCSSLSNITIPDGITEIGFALFDGCSGLKSITIPESVTFVDMTAFAGCDSLTDVYYAGTQAQWDAITIDSYNESLTNATIHTVEPEEPSIGGSCGDNVTWALDDNGVLTISGTGPMTDVYPWDENIPFSSYKAQIKEVVIEPGITYIGTYLFADCFNLTKVTIPEGVTTISDQAFRNCYNLKDITLPDGLKTIGWEAFASCGSLTGIDIPDSVKYISDSAFRYNNLTSVYIPASVTDIGPWAFSGAGSFEVDPNNPNYSNDATGALLNKEQTTLLQVPGNVTGTYVVADGVTIIGDGAFEDCSSMTGVVLPSSITRIEFTAFDYCSALTDVYYNGTQEQKENISISEMAGDEFLAATWHYVVAAQDDSGTTYSTVEDALEAVTSGKVTLLDNATAGNVVLKPGVTLDLNGYTLTADLVVAMKGAVITDGEACVGGGLLKVAKDNLALDDNDGIIPVWNGTDGYIFTKVMIQQAGDEDVDYVQRILLPVFSNTDVAALLADGGLDNGLKIKVRLSWAGGQCQQFYTYSDDLVKQVYDGTDQWVFDLKITGVDGITDLLIAPEVVADCGAIAVGAEY